MPIDYRNYPKDWPEIRARILERDHHCCKFCGLADHSWIVRSDQDGARYLLLGDNSIFYLGSEPIRASEIPDEFAINPLIRVVLTVAHLDHDVTHSDDANLAALCQRCHLLHDTKQRVASSARTRRKHYIERTGQGELF
jgi:hypothetical protein